MNQSELAAEIAAVSVLFNEPKLLKSERLLIALVSKARFIALQRAEIAEILSRLWMVVATRGFSALQRAEIAEIVVVNVDALLADCFSALQRAEIAEIAARRNRRHHRRDRFQCSSTSRNC